MENVPQVIGNKNKEYFNEWVNFLNSLGYSSKWQILNAKDFGIPQNRKRCFMISILGEFEYEFPETQELKLKLKDLLEDEVDESFYLTPKKIETIRNWKAQQNPFKDIDKEKECCQTLTARGAGEEHSGMVLVNEDVYKETYTKQKEVCEKALSILKPNQAIDYSYANSRLEELKQGKLCVRNSENPKVSPTLTTRCFNFGFCVENLPLKEQLCKELIDNNLVEESDMIRHSYTNNRLNNGIENMKRTESKEKLCPTLDTRCDCLGVVVNDRPYTEMEKQLFTKDGNIKRYINSEIVDEFKEGQMATTTYPNGYGHGSRTHDESVSLNTIDKPSVKQNLRIRKLTPKECFRLMGVKDSDFQNIARNQSNASLYHLAGDSIVVNVLMAIIKNLI